MLYDPKWDQQTKADPFTLISLIAWLEKQPSDETYCYTSIGHCLIAQYLNAHGIRTDNVNPSYYFDERNGSHPLPAAFNEIANGCSTGGDTFGAALTRARSMPSPQGTKS